MNLLIEDIRRKQNNYVLVQRFFNRVIKIILQHGTLAVCVYRLGHGINNLPIAIKLIVLPLYFFINALTMFFTGVYINRKQAIGGGFVIHNFANIHIDAKQIGANLTINQGVYIGQTLFSKGKPVLGNNIFIGAGAKIIGPVTIGDNVVIAANSTVTKDVPERCLVAGVPGIIIARNLQDDYVDSVKAHDKE